MRLLEKQSEGQLGNTLFNYMAATSPCLPCCPTPQTVNVPGVEGLPGIDGTAGVSAFTAVSPSSFVIPAVNSTVTVSVLDSSWMAIGELVFVSDGTDKGTFQVTALPTTTSVTLKFLGYQLDSLPGATIDVAAIVTPTGQRFTIPAPTVATGSGAAYEVNNTMQAIVMGAGSPSIVLPATGNFLINGMVNAKFLSASFAAPGTMTLKIRNITAAADLTPNLVVTNPIITTITDEWGVFNFPQIYAAGTSGDTIQIWAQGSVNPFPDNYSAGVHAVQVTQTQLSALQIS